MSALSVSNTFVANTTIFSAEVNQNFSDIISWANGNIANDNFGTMTGEISWSISSNVFAIDIANAGTEGSINIAQSGVLASGKSALKVAASGTQNAGAALVDFSFSGAATIPLIKGAHDGTGNLLELGQTGSDKFKINSAGLFSLGGVHSAQYLNNLSIEATVGSSALTVTLKGAAGGSLSSTNAGSIGFRSSTLTSGAPVVRTLTANPSLVISSGSTLGTISSTACDIYVYAIDNAGTVELAVSMKLFDEGQRVSTTAEGGAGAADTSTTMYSTTARSNVACRLIGRLTSNQTTAGTWAAVPTEITMVPFKERKPIALYKDASTSIGTGNTVVNFTSAEYDTHSLVTTGVGWNFKVDRPGFWEVSAGLRQGVVALSISGAFGIGIRNNTTLMRQGLATYGTGASNQYTTFVTGIIHAVPGDLIDIVAAISAGPSALNGASTDNYVHIRFLGSEH